MLDIYEQTQFESYLIRKNTVIMPLSKTIFVIYIGIRRIIRD